MPTLYHLEQYLATKRPKGSLFQTALMVFFFIAFDGTLMYLAPIVMHNSGIREGTMGLIIGLSSVAGLLFDIVLARLLKDATYRGMFLLMLLIASTYPFFLFGANSITMYLIAMAVWGLYYNLYNMGTIDYVERATTSDQYTSYFGVLRVFDGLGNLVAPFIGSILIIIASTNFKMLPWVLGILIPAFLFYFTLYAARLDTTKECERRTAYSILTEWRLLEKIGHVLFPVLLLTLTINILDSAVWTIGPLFSESLSLPWEISGGIFMIAYTLPPLLVGWFVGRIAKRYGKKKTAITALFIGSLLLMLVGSVSSPAILLSLIFCASFCFALAWPTINSAYADDIASAPHYGREIETVEDWFTNVGDALGPILAGYAAQFFGTGQAFTILGIIGTIASLILLWYTPSSLGSIVHKKDQQPHPH